MYHDDSNPYDPNALPVWDEHSEQNSPRTLCESYAQDLLERAAERRREIARDHADDKRHLEGAIELDRLAVEVRALARSPLEATFETALFFAEGDCQKINVLAIQKENELVRSIGFGGHCATGVDFIATVIEKANRLIAREDEDVSSAVTEILDAEGIAVRADAECTSFQSRGDDIAVGVKCSSGAPEVVGSHVLLAVGRRPNTDDLGLSEAGVAIDERGFIRVDDELATDVPGVFALGDCNGKGAFTHTSYNDFEIVAANLLDHQLRRVSDRVTAYALYTDPPLGRAGLNEREARSSGHKIRIGMRPMTRVGRAVEKAETKGFMKILVDAETEAILGAAILGVGGDEAIHCVLDIIYAKAPYRVLQHAVHIHPTVSELIPTLLSELGPAS